ncbi:zinc finger CCCH domain-containing protein 13-like [Juglans microcarpa x Juglans regia]|uniref:zinc finger CCCH domain-containing protein 13-like n=1 Tax=Juglans microcarpa x Juglans regia TaxID=2249226 RepID=UPI001B7F555D|nr:zinc finger CCCH domain-containing protein 13-like [Juglans microcarpa x Juglans regia]
MELQLGLKIAKTSDDLTSIAEFQFAKDRTGPVFLSGEDDNMFILTVHLKGFRRDNINIKINEDGTRITVHGEKRVQQTVMIGWILHKKGVELRVFKKVFKIPDGVVLDRIKAKFNENESILTIIMPKREKGIRGDGIEEVKEDEVGRKTGKSEREQIVDNKVSERDKDGVKNLEESKEPEIKRMDETDPVVVKETSEMTKFVEEIPRKDTVGERVYEKSKETDILSQPAEEEARKRGLELEATKTVVKEFPEREYIGEKVLEKIKQPKMKKVDETDGVVKEKVGRGKPETVTIVAEKVPKGEKEAQEPESKIAKETQPIVETSEKVKEITDERELGEADPKNLETVLTSKHPEVGTMKPTIETWSKELPAWTEQTNKQEIQEVEKVEANGMEEEKSTKDEPGLAEHKIPREPHDLMSHIDVQELTKSKADQEEPEQVETLQPQKPVEQLGKDEVTKPEKTNSLGNEIQEASNEGSLQEKEGESEQEKDLGEGATPEKKPVSRRCNLGVPCVVAGSAILVSIIAFVIHIIKATKRK